MDFIHKTILIRSNRYFDLESGRFKPVFIDSEKQLDEEISTLWSSYLGCDYEEADALKLNSVQRKKVLDQQLKYYRNHVDGLGEIRSLDVLHAFFHDFLVRKSRLK